MNGRSHTSTRGLTTYTTLSTVDWLSTRIDLLQQDLDTIRKKDPQPATSIDICTITSIDSKFVAMEDRLQTYEDMHDRFTSPIMRYLDTLSTQMMTVQRDIGKLNDQHDFHEEGSTLLIEGSQSHSEQLASQHQISASINKERSKSIDSKALAWTDKHLVASIDTTSTPDDKQLIQNKTESMHDELNELSAYAYDKIGWHQISIENILERLQNISNAIQKMSLKEISSELTIRGRYEEEVINRCTSCTIDDVETRNALVPADFKPKASPNYKITPDEF
ncbi:hypothetical protein DY000_02042593 [Brassica cretica]|uniref:Uncharacterized protein n=1 Tax=Brassica cretica TaxID=69181 RepID=A0ABQ7BMI6_BRACR|nr:hypothetical protein DY000_02042593 [Brassica cretica]